MAKPMMDPDALIDMCVVTVLAARTLRRHLQELGTHYQELLDELRFERAKTLLGQEDWPICRIAEYLGFSETASFRHAFQRWSGVPPSRFRA